MGVARKGVYRTYECTYTTFKLIVDLCRAKDALQASVEGLRAQPGLLSDPVVLEFSGVSSFGKGVVFAGIKGGEGRERLSRIAG